MLALQGSEHARLFYQNTGWSFSDFRGSEEMLRRGIENVVRNAVRYTAEHTQVNITVSQGSGRSGDEAVIRLRDHARAFPRAPCPS